MSHFILTFNEEKRGRYKGKVPTNAAKKVITHNKDLHNKIFALRKVRTQKFIYFIGHQESLSPVIVFRGGSCYIYNSRAVVKKLGTSNDCIKWQNNMSRIHHILKSHVFIEDIVRYIMSFLNLPIYIEHPSYQEYKCKGKNCICKHITLRKSRRLLSK